LHYSIVFFHLRNPLKNDFLIEICFTVSCHQIFWFWKKFFLASGLLSTLEQARIDGDQDLNFQIDIFIEDQKHDEEEFLGHFDANDNQAVCQAIQLQVCSLKIINVNLVFFF
jgi:hypothetical protein